MTRAALAVPPSETTLPTQGDSARTQRTVPESSNRAVGEVIARLVGLAEDLARVAADLVVSLPAMQPTPVVVQSEATGRTAWTVQEFADSLGLAKSTVYRLIGKGEIRHGRVNGSIRISEQERQRWWAEREQRAADELGVAS